MKKIRFVLIRLGSLLASIALVMGVVSSQAVCIAFYHQPKVPQGMSRFVRK
jgi:cyclic lactone autoinducer peptide